MPKNLEIQYLKKADKFLSKNANIISKNDVDLLIIKAIKKIFSDEDVNIDLKSMSTMENYYRIRKGNVRIIFYIDENDDLIVSVVETIGYRGDVYKK
jgi:mRNA-degrading endonuclease RelE of RelBE toxin-antitoxin system